MKTYLSTIASGLASVLLLAACATSDQYANIGNDPMYAQYRENSQVEFTALNEKAAAKYDEGSYEFTENSISSKTVNPDLIAEYQNQDNRDAEETAEYYVDEYDRQSNDRPIINNYYGSSNFGNPYNRGGFNSFYDPFDPFYSNYYDPYYSPFYDPFWGPSRFHRPRAGFGVGFGMGFAFGNAWGNNWGGRNNYWNDPFYSPYAYGNGFYGRPYGNSFYGRPYYGYGNPIVIINNNGSEPGRTRNVTYGRQGYSRNSGLTSTPDASRDLNGRRSRIVNNTSRSSTSNARTNTANARYSRSGRNTGTSNVTKQRNELYGNNRSTSSRTSSSYNRTAPASRSNSSNTYNNNSRTNSSRGAVRSSSPSRNNYSSGNSDRSYQRSSGSRSNSSSSPSYNSGSNSRSSSPSYSAPSNSGSRSGSYSSGSSGSSRSGSSSSSSSRGSSRSGGRP